MVHIDRAIVILNLVARPSFHSDDKFLKVILMRNKDLLKVFRCDSQMFHSVFDTICYTYQ